MTDAAGNVAGTLQASSTAATASPAAAVAVCYPHAGHLRMSQDPDIQKPYQGLKDGDIALKYRTAQPCEARSKSVTSSRAPCPVLGACRSRSREREDRRRERSSRSRSRDRRARCVSQQHMQPCTSSTCTTSAAQTISWERQTATTATTEGTKSLKPGMEHACG
jgi:hypothetical protein